MTIKKKTTKIKTNWDLKLLYKSLEDPKIEEDVKILEKEYEKFAKKYSDKKYLTNKDILLSALSDYENLGKLKSPMYFFYFIQDLDSKNKKAESLKNKYYQRLTNVYNKALFFTLSLSELDEKKEKEILSDESLKKYKYFFHRLFITKKHNLKEGEEKIMKLKSQTSRTMWVEASDKLLNNKEILFKGKKYSPGEAVNRIKESPLPDRYKLDKKLVDTLKECSFMAEAELNAIVTDKKISDELRGYKKPYSATVESYENEEVSVESLVSSVTKYFHVSNKFFDLKKRMMKLPVLKYADRAVAVGNVSKKIPFEKSVELVNRAFSSVDKEFSDILASFLQNGQIDVFPKIGKTGGAYCSSDINRPTFVLLNYTESFDSIMTFAHEMGHAIHGELSHKSQSPIYSDYTISVAEVASTLFENFAFEEISKELTEKEKTLALFNRIHDDIGTIFRQIACFNFELDMHNSIREKGYLPKEDLAKMMNKHMKAYLGKSFKLEDDDGYFFVYWSHIRNFFYVYSYAYGQLISKVLYKRYKENPAFIKNIKEFLSAGGSMSPEDIFKKCGLDTRDPKFFEEGLKSIEEDVKNLEKLLKKQKMI